MISNQEKEREYRVEVHGCGECDPAPTVVVFSIDLTLAREIVKLAALVEGNGLHQVEKFDYRACYLQVDPVTDAEAAAELRGENQVQMECEMMVVGKDSFHFAAYIKHTSVLVSCGGQSLADLVEYFGLAGEDVTSSVPVKYWDTYGTVDTAETHRIDVTDRRRASGQVLVDVGAIEGKIDDVLCLTVEVNTSPIEAVDHVGCVHVHFDGDNLAMSLFKIGERILVRPEAGVTLSAFVHHGETSGEKLFWVA